MRLDDLGLDVDVTGVTADSRAVRPGDLFVALTGARADGRAFIGEAVARGAAAVLAPRGTAWPDGVPARPLLTDEAPRRTLARVAARLAGPAPDCVAMVTGTNGKTSTVEFLRQLWKADGRRAASIGTLGVIAPGMAPGGGLTTPDPVALAATLARLRRDGVRAVAMEASSHGLDQCRLDGVTPAAAALTNLTRDHLDYHGSMAEYRAAKLRLFDTLLPAGAPAVVSSETDVDTLAELRAVAARRRLDLRIVGADGDAVRIEDATPVPEGQRLTFVMDGVRHAVVLKLPGRFQADNALVALTMAAATGARDPVAAFPRLRGVRGRLEFVAVLPNGAAAYVDYAHTPDALSRVIAAMRPHAPRLHIVFGAGGDRDPGKRPLMGAAAGAADVSIVTDDNPRSENPAAIRAAVLAGAPGAREVGDRRQAVAEALAGLGPGDVLIVAGKGHEQGQIVAGETLPFDDAAVIRELTGA